MCCVVSSGAMSAVLAHIPDKEALRAEKCRRSLGAFIEDAWPILEPGTPYVHSFHVDVIVEHLEACARGEIKRLLINIPPRMTKSLIVSVLFPLWVWASKPSEQFLCAAYRAALAVRDSNKTMRVLQSQWYQRNWGHKFGLTLEQAQKIETTQAGYRLITSVVGGATGDGGNYLILDDPHSVTQAESEAERLHALDWFDLTWSTRLNNMKTGCMITVMQRLHELDVAGHVLADFDDWEHLCLPMEFDGVRRTTSLGAYDIRTKKGELLCPERVGPKELAQLKKSLGEYGTSGQLQQDPSPPGGGIIKTDRIRILRQAPHCFYIVQSLDTAFTANTAGDPSAFSVYGVFKMQSGRNGVCLLDAWSEHMDYPTLRRRIIGGKDDEGVVIKGEWQMEYGGDLERGIAPRKADAIVIEEKGSGIVLCQDMLEANVPVFKYNPGKQDKIARAHAVAPIIETDCFFVIESENNPGFPKSWAVPYISQLGKFPVGAHDDWVDTMTQAFLYMRTLNMFDLDFVPREVDRDRDYHEEARRRQNPYAA